MTITNELPTTSCPAWCSADHTIDRDFVERGKWEPDSIWHYGPKFGAHIRVGTYRGVPLGMIDDCQTDDATATELRALAAHALEAAEWLEARA